jgi:hypothetical protein
LLGLLRRLCWLLMLAGNLFAFRQSWAGKIIQRVGAHHDVCKQAAVLKQLSCQMRTAAMFGFST